MTEPTYKQLQDAAKQAGVKSFGKKKSDLIAEVGHLVSQDTPVETVHAPDRSETRATARETTGRSGRIPLGVARLKLDYPARDGYVRRWVNDRGTRLMAAEQAGYTFVTEEHDGRDMQVSRVVGTQEDGSPMVAHLMEIRKEFYEEDQAEKERRNALVDEQLMRRVDPQDAGAEDRGRFYTPDEGRSLKSSVG